MTAAYIRILRNLVGQAMTEVATRLCEVTVEYAEGCGDWNDVEALQERVNTLQQIDAHLALDEQAAQFDDEPTWPELPDHLPDFELDEGDVFQFR